MPHLVSALRLPLLPLLTLLFLLLTPPAHAMQPYNITLSDQSPMITYWPARSSAASAGWNVSYTQSSWSNYTNQTIGMGQSSHTTSMQGATATVSWVGTSVWFTGTVQGSVNLTVDGSYLGDTWGATGFTYGWHVATLSLEGTGTLQLTGATIEIGMGNEGATVSNSSQAALYNGDSINPQLGIGEGAWEAATLVGGGGGSITDTYNRIDTHTPYSKLTINAPANTSFVVLLGSVNYDHANYAVWLTPGTSNTATPTNQTFNGLSPWIGTGQVVYYATVDPTISVQVTVEFLGVGWQYFDLAQAIFMIASGGEAPAAGTKSSNTGAIVGGVVGGIAALVVAAAGLLFWLRRRRAARKTTLGGGPVPADEVEENTPFEVDDREMRLTPFYDNPSAAYAGAASGSPFSIYNDPYSPNAAPTSTSSSGNQSRTHLQAPGSTPTRLSLATLPPDHECLATGSSAGRSSSSSAALLTPGSAKRGARNSRDSVPVRQEEDAGRVETVPPSYDPSWARDRESESEGTGTVVTPAAEESEV